jgi:Brp/Blh family beta-carotene 15,15'-monooxygenase
MIGKPTTLLVWGFTIALACWWQISAPVLSSESVILLLLVAAVIGMPHGASDLVVARRELSLASRPRTALFSYTILYLTLTMGVLVLWSFMPLFCTVGFLIVSWIHFGEFHHAPEADRPAKIPLEQRLIEGGIPIWLPLLTLDQQAWTVIGWLAGRDGQLLMTQFDANWAIVLWVLLGSCVVFWFFKTVWLMPPGTGSPRNSLGMFSRWALYAFLFISTPPLLAFAVYFTLWHAPQHLVGVFRQSGQLAGAGLSQTDFTLLLGATILPLAFGVWAACTPQQTSQLMFSTTRSTFIGLAALTIPHLLNQQLLMLTKQQFIDERNLMRMKA